MTQRSRPAGTRGARAIAVGALGAVLAGLVGAAPAPADATTCLPGPQELVPVLRLNAGGPELTVDGQLWQADTGFRGGQAVVRGRALDVQDTSADELYLSSRVGRFGYELDVPTDAEYVVRLHEAELMPVAPGGRVFSLHLEGGPVGLTDYDIAGDVGVRRAVVEQFRVAVADGHLSIASSATAGQAKLSAVEVLRVQPSACTSPPPDRATRERVFAATSAWNSPVPAAPVLDSGSAAMVRSVTPRNAAYADIYEYGFPVFEADAGTPWVPVRCTMPWGVCDLERGVRIPDQARPSTGSDAAMVVVDPVAGTSCDFWQARRTGQGWTASWGTCASLDGPGSGPSGGATGAGVNALAGLVRTQEIAAGRIDHALTFSTDNSCRGVYRYPATKTDGVSGRVDCLPEGARVQLDPSVDVDALPGITPGERAVARALQTYGAYNRDNGGAPLAFMFQTPTGGVDPYPAAGFGWDYYDMPHIPWDKLRVLRQWDGS